MRPQRGPMPALAVGVLDVVVDEAEVVAELDGRGTRQRLAVVAGERLVGEHAEQRTHALAARAAAAVQAEVVGEHLVQRPGVAAALVQDARHLGLDVGQDLAKLGPDVHGGRVPDLLDEPCHAAGRGAGSDASRIMIHRCSTFRARADEPAATRLQDRGHRPAHDGPRRGRSRPDRPHAAARQAAGHRQGRAPHAVAHRRRAPAVQRRAARAGGGAHVRRRDLARRSRTRTSACATTCTRPPPPGTSSSWPTASARAPPTRTRPSGCWPRRCPASMRRRRGVARGGRALVRAPPPRGDGLPARARRLPRLRCEHRAGGQRLLAGRWRRASARSACTRPHGARPISADALKVLRHLQRSPLVGVLRLRLATAAASRGRAAAARHRLRRARARAAHPRLPRRGRRARGRRVSDSTSLVLVVTGLTRPTCQRWAECGSRDLPWCGSVHAGAHPLSRSPLDPPHGS